MDNNQRYSEFDEQFNDLPIPGADESWQKMKLLLDEDDRKKRPVLPFSLRSCAGWGVAIMLVVALTWWLVRPEGIWKKDSLANEGQKPANKLMPGKDKPATPVKENDGSTVHSNRESGFSSNKLNEVNSGETGTARVSKPGLHYKGSTKSGRLAGRIDDNFVKRSFKGNGWHSGANVRPTNSKPTDRTDNSQIANSGFRSSPIFKIAITPSPVGNTSSVNQNTSFGASDADKSSKATPGVNPTKAKTDKPILKNKPLSDTTAVDKDRIKNSRWIVSAGIGLQQQIPVGGQKAVPYDYYGRTGSLSDYIPSVYLRLEKEKKWFIQGEFRYGAPQTLEDFQYSRLTKIDSQIQTVTTYRLKKTYYHQFPFSFNYFVLPELSVGVGGIYNRFYGAVTEKEVKKKDLQTQVETLSREIVNIQHFNDSFLYKTQVHALVQADYHWKRFNFGLRYTKDIQPFIKYTQPDGKIDVKKNQTFQFLVRFRIWQWRNED